MEEYKLMELLISNLEINFKYQKKKEIKKRKIIKSKNYKI